MVRQRPQSCGEWAGWLTFFLDVLAQSAQRTVATIDRILDLQNTYQQRATQISQSSNMVTLVNVLFEQPVVAATDVERKVGVTNAAARNLLDQLVSAGLIEEARQYYPRLWIARELLDVARP